MYRSSSCLSSERFLLPLQEYPCHGFMCITYQAAVGQAGRGKEQRHELDSYPQIANHCIAKQEEA
jgi:hypothetical protein